MKLRLTINGKIYEVEVEMIEQDQPHRGQLPSTVHSAMAAQVVGGMPSTGSTLTGPTLADPSSATGSGPVDEGNVFRSPISGVVVRVPVQVGQTVKTNDVLMVLEAMKMETAIASQLDGKISKINAAVGDSVQVKQVLVEFV